MAEDGESLSGTEHETCCISIDDPKLTAALEMHARAAGLSVEALLARIVHERLRELADAALQEGDTPGVTAPGSDFKH